MTREDIMEMANQVGLVGKPTYTEGLEAFARLVAQNEREACATIVMNKIDNTSPTRLNTPKDWWNKACQNVLGAIQARGRK